MPKTLRLLGVVTLACREYVFPGEVAAIAGEHVKLVVNWLERWQQDGHVLYDI